MRKILLFSWAVLYAATAYPQVTYHNVYRAKSLWSRMFDYVKMDDVMSSPGGMALDDSGNIYIVGTSVFDSLTFQNGRLRLKYSPSGKQLWFNVDTTSASLAATSRDHAVVWDSAKGSIVTCGEFNVVPSLSAFGNSGNFTVTQFSRGGIMGQEYSLPDNGSQVHFAVANNLCSDAHGIIYATGYVGQTANSHKVFTTMKIDIFNLSAPKIWATGFDSTELYGGQGQFVATDAQNNVIVAGTRTDSFKTSLNGSTTLFCIKYDSLGNIKWKRNYANTDTFGVTQTNGLALSKSGNIYTCGTIAKDANGNIDGAVLKYSSSGKLSWAKRLASMLPQGQSAGCSDLKTDGSGNVFVSGFIETDSGSYAALIKFDSTGKVLALDTLHDQNILVSSEANALALDDSGNAYIAGTLGDGQSFTDAFAARYSNVGVKQWFTEYNDSSSSYNTASAIAIDKQGDVVVAGGHDGGAATGADIVLLKYSQSMARVKDSVKDTSSMVGPMPNAFSASVDLYPNPTSGQLTCTVTLSESADLRMDFYDMTGKQVKSLYCSSLPAGQNHIATSLGGLGEGLYMYHCTITGRDGVSYQNGKLSKQ